MIKINEAIIVEGKYDKIKLESVVDAPIIVTNGFAIFKDKQKLDFIRRLACKRGIIIMTDSDSAGFMIRSFIGGSVPKERVKHAYIPDIFGKERRKRTPSSEGKLGVEGVPIEVIRDALCRAGVMPSESAEKSRLITKADLFAAGLSGGTDSKQRRHRLLKHLNLPENMSANSLLDALNIFVTYDEFTDTVNRLFGGDSVG